MTPLPSSLCVCLFRCLGVPRALQVERMFAGANSMLLREAAQKFAAAATMGHLRRLQSALFLTPPPSTAKH